MELTIDTMQEAQNKINRIMGLLVNCKDAKLAPAPRGKVNKAIDCLFAEAIEDTQIAALDNFIQKAVLVWASTYYGPYVPNIVLCNKLVTSFRTNPGLKVYRGIRAAADVLVNFHMCTLRLPKDNFIHEIFTRETLIQDITKKLELSEYDYSITEQDFKYIMSNEQKEKVLAELTLNVNKVQPITTDTIAALGCDRLTHTETLNMYRRIHTTVKLPSLKPSIVEDDATQSLEVAV